MDALIERPADASAMLRAKINNYIKNMSSGNGGTMSEFVELCCAGHTLDDIFEIARLYTELNADGNQNMLLKTIYHHTVGWALTSQKACGLILDAWNSHVKLHPGANFVDLGAGSGIFSYIMCKMGVPQEKIIALELVKPTHVLEGQRKFFPLVTSYKIKPADLLFVAWGWKVNAFVKKYIVLGTCVVIIGEKRGGCTFPVNYFADNAAWNFIIEQVPAGTLENEYLSVNTRK